MTGHGRGNLRTTGSIASFKLPLALDSPQLGHSCRDDLTLPNASTWCATQDRLLAGHVDVCCLRHRSDSMCSAFSLGREPPLLLLNLLDRLTVIGFFITHLYPPSEQGWSWRRGWWQSSPDTLAGSRSAIGSAIFIPTQEIGWTVQRHIDSHG